MHSIASAVVEPLSTPPIDEVERLRATLPAPLRRQLRRARELGAPASGERLSTAIKAIDRLLPGGLPRGRLVEIVGRRSSGRFSLVLSTLAAVTGTGDCAALVDLGDGLDARADGTEGRFGLLTPAAATARWPPPRAATASPRPLTAGATGA